MLSFCMEWIGQPWPQRRAACLLSAKCCAGWGGSCPRCGAKEIHEKKIEKESQGGLCGPGSRSSSSPPKQKSVQAGSAAVLPQDPQGAGHQELGHQRRRLPGDTPRRLVRGEPGVLEAAGGPPAAIAGPSRVKAQLQRMHGGAPTPQGTAHAACMRCTCAMTDRSPAIHHPSIHQSHHHHHDAHSALPWDDEAVSSCGPLGFWRGHSPRESREAAYIKPGLHTGAATAFSAARASLCCVHIVDPAGRNRARLADRSSATYC
jgi:hypothetical protein